jgi:hypothetical protein
MSCHFCDSKLKHLVTYDARYFIRSDKYLLNNNNINLWIDDLNKNSCVNCGIKYMRFKYSNNKINKIINREINSKINFSKKIDPNKLNIKEYCILCKKQIKNLTYYDSINTRENYVEGIGQFCKDCFDIEL